jgi:hypothetical protein
MKSILIYNLFPRTIWKDVTRKLLSNVHHDSIVVHVTMPHYAWLYKFYIRLFLMKFNKVDKVFFSINTRKRGESIGFNKIRRKVDFDSYDIISYIHSKGTSRKRKNTKPIKDWTEVMRYFVVEKLDLCKEAFNSGYYLFGINLSKNLGKKDSILYPDTKFIYEGNFVSLNNRLLKNEFKNKPCRADYYGVERFWGSLCEMDKAFCAHQTNTDHYNFEYPDKEYK